ncbi:MAG: TetR/AcrR family transcriptional regulator [Deltaproteobacteria bacterium]|nr:TetR/AcrR family transcriptional regulator [Deltaproteobacteria bacterium]
MVKGNKSGAGSSRTNIMNAAGRLFVQKGYHGTSVADIASATGLTAGALYRHFNSKEELLMALIRKFEADFLDSLSEELKAHHEEALDALGHFFIFAGRFAGRDPDLAILLAIVSAEFQGIRGKIGEELNRVYARYARVLRRIIEEGKRQNQFDQNLDTHSLAYMIIGLMEGAYLKFQHNRSILDSGDYLRTFQQLLLQGLKPVKMQ